MATLTNKREKCNRQTISIYLPVYKSITQSSSISTTYQHIINWLHTIPPTNKEYVYNEKTTIIDDTPTVCNRIIIDVQWIGKFYYSYII